MQKVEINVMTRGHVSGGAKREITNVLKDCYHHFSYKAPNKLELLIAEREIMRRDFMREERFRLGITDEFDEEHFCSYDSLRNYPRITTSLEGLNQLSKTAKLGAIRHEAAHTALHGTMEYRIFQMPDEFRQTAHIKSIELPVLDQAIHNVSNAVKDCEVSKFLIEFNFIECQAAYALECLDPPAIDKLSAHLAKTERQTRFIYRTALLIPLLCAVPLILLPKSKRISPERRVLLGRKAEEITKLVGGSEQNKFLQVANAIADNITEDTHKNVDFALRQAIGLA